MASRDCGWRGSGRPLGECTAGRHGLLHSTKNGCKRLSRSRAAATSVRRREQRPQPGRGKVCGRARRRALCARCARLACQVSPRAARHARTHEYHMHHTAWTARSPHVLAGRSQAVELTCNGYFLALQVVGRCMWWWCMPWCNGLLRFVACVDRKRSPDRPLIARVQHAL